VKRSLVYIAVLILVILIALFVLGQLSRSGNAPGLVNGKLQPCPDSPNCVCSEYSSDGKHFIAPIDAGDVTMMTLQQAITELGGTIETDAENYVAATFRSPLFGFVDDLEIRVDSVNDNFQVRSASRVGHSDLDANRKRVERLRQWLLEKNG
jgi:uncharacterized protein (DUF1499 family)